MTKSRKAFRSGRVRGASREGSALPEERHGPPFRPEAGARGHGTRGFRAKRGNEGAREVLLEFSMFPLGKGESVGKYVARSLDIVDRSGLDYRLHTMGTVLEGGWDEAFGVVKKCFERMRRDCRRVTVSIKVDYRRGARGRLWAKVAGVEKRLGRRLKTV